MRELTIGQTKLRVRATAPALFFYKQEFKSDLIGDLTKLEKVRKDPSQIDSVAILQLVWAMAKTDALAFNNQFPSFLAWLETLDSFDFLSPEFMGAALEEAANGFFRGAKQRGNPKHRGNRRK